MTKTRLKNYHLQMGTKTTSSLKLYNVKNMYGFQVFILLRWTRWTRCWRRSLLFKPPSTIAFLISPPNVHSILQFLQWYLGADILLAFKTLNLVLVDSHLGHCNFWSLRNPTLICWTASIVRGPKAAGKLHQKCWYIKEIPKNSNDMSELTLTDLEALP